MRRNSFARVLLAMILCSSLILCCSCADEPAKQPDCEPLATATSAGMRSTTLYMLSDDGFVVPVVKQIPWEEGIGRAAVMQLVATEQNKLDAARMGLNPVLPDGVDVSLRIADDGVATINIMNMEAFEDAQSEQAMVNAVSGTLLEFGSIDAVQFKFDGKEVKTLENGTLVGNAIDTVSLNTEAGELATSADGGLTRFTLYYPNLSCSLNVPVTRYVQGAPTLDSALNELMKAPQLDGLRQCFPEGTRVNSCELYGGELCVDVSREFLQAVDTPGLVEACTDSLCLTGGCFGRVDELKLTVEGAEFTQNVAAPVFANLF